MKSADVVIVGGGIAGLAAAFCLARQGRQVVLLERESVFASHSSGRNAAIFRHLDGSPGGVELAVRSGELLDELMGSRQAWLARHGQLFVASSAARLEGLVSLARRHDIPFSVLDQGRLEERSPFLRGGAGTCALFVPDDGVMDVHGVCSALADGARSAGASLRAGVEVAKVDVVEGRIQGVRLTDGSAIAAPEVVIAAGAWGGQLGETAGAPLALRALRRHIALLDAPCPADAPVVWCVDDEAYFRGESGGALASPCDEELYEPCLPPESPAARELLAEKLARLAPGLAESGVRRGWACLRTFAADRALVIGPDRRVPGLSWIVGLGGHGMTAGVASGELLARALRGERSVLQEALSPTRFVPAP